MSCCLSQTEILDLSSHGYLAEHKDGLGFLGCGSWAGKTFLCRPNASKIQVKWFQRNKTSKVTENLKKYKFLIFEKKTLNSGCC